MRSKDPCSILASNVTNGGAWIPETVVNAISRGGYAGATARQCCLRQWFVTAIEVGEHGLVFDSLAGSAFEEKPGFVRTAQVA